MQIALIIPDLSLGGAQQSAINFCNLLIRNDAVSKITVYQWGQDGAFSAYLDSRVQSKIFCTSTLGMFRLLVELFKTSQQGQLIIVGWSHYANAYAIFFALSLGLTRSLVISERTDIEMLMRASGIRGLLSRFIIKKLYRIPIILTANSVANCEKIQRLYPSKRVDLLPNYIDESRVFGGPWRDVIPNGLDDREDTTAMPMRILLIGRLAPEKGFDVAFKAIAVARVSCDLVVKVVGDGPSGEYLRDLVSELGLTDVVEFYGSNQHPGDQFLWADIAVFASRSEGYPNALAEAMYAGTVCISSDCETGPSEMIRHGVSGYLFPVDDVVGLTALILEVRDLDENGRKIIGERAKVAMKEKHGERAVVAQYKRLVSALRVDSNDHG